MKHFRLPYSPLTFYRALFYIVTLMLLPVRPVSSPIGPFPEPAITARGMGNPWMNYTDGTYLPSKFDGATLLSNAMDPMEAHSLTAGDFDEDGLSDLVSGYSTIEGGLIGIRRGNIDVLFPHTEAAKARKAAGTYVHDPFFAPVQLFNMGLSPEFLEAGDFNADGHIDLVAGSRSSTSLTWLPGLGDGTFEAARSVTLAGNITALEAGDLNRRDGLTDLAVGIENTESAQLLIFEGPNGALQHEPEVYELDAPASTISINQFDEHYAIDLAVAAGHELRFISGRDRRLSLSAEHQVHVVPATQRVHQLSTPVSDMVAGHFNRDRQTDLVLLSSDGNVARFDGATHKIQQTPYTFSGADITLTASRLSTIRGDDVVMLDRTNNLLHVLHTTHINQEIQTPRAFVPEQTDLPVPTLAPITLNLNTTPAAVRMMRLNGDGMMDIVIQAKETDQMAVAMSAPMGTFEVNTSTMERDFLDDGLCLTEFGECSLRAAIEELNRSEGPHTITFQVGTVQTVFTTGQIPTATKVVFIDGESFGSRVEILGDRTHIQISASVAEGSVIRGLSLGTIVTWDGATIENNYVLVNGAGTGVTNDGTGVSFFSDNNLLGGTTEEARNIIGRVSISGVNNEVLGNYIGTDVTGNASVGSDVIGLQITGSEAENNTIGAAVEGAGNVISGQLESIISGANGFGIKMSGSGNLIQGNLIGTNADGTSPLGNGDDNIQNFGSNTIGGTAAGAGNVISASQGTGIFVSASVENETLLIQGNKIGTDITGLVALGNAEQGINLTASPAIIGGAEPGSGNVISANGGDGIRISGSFDKDGPHIIQGNWIGTDITGTRALGNGGDGIEISNAFGSTIGGERAEEANIIAYNMESGVRLFANNAVGHRISRNHIFDNEQLGIKLGAGANIENNDNGDDDTGPNNEQNYPVMTVNADGTVNVSLNSIASQTYHIEFYGNPVCDASGNGEGQEFLQAEEVTTDAAGNGVFDTTLLVFKGQEFVAATATDPDGNTSEFSMCVEVDPIIPIVVRVMQDSLNHVPTPIPNTEFQIAKADFSNPDDPFTFVDTQFSDANGELQLSLTDFARGDPFLLQARVAQVAAVKSGHEDVDNLQYEVLVDNLNITRQGQIQPDTLWVSENDTTVTFLGHTSYKYNLVVSIEWPASDAYIANLEIAFRNAGNLLYDIANGQAYFGKVAIYDNKRKWKNADIRIYANNTTWPSTSGLLSINKTDSYIKMPPKHFGSKQQNITNVYPEEVLTPFAFDNLSTYVHEWGHYALGLYDEYQDSLEQRVHPFINFGFMDSHYEGLGISSEMSAFESLAYSDTEQFQRRGRTSWDFLHDTLSTTYGEVRAEIHTPKLLGLQNNERVDGPNEALDAPDYNVGALMELIVHASSANDPRPGYLLVDGTTGQPAPGMEASVQKLPSRRWMPQGKTVLTGPDKGKIRPLGLSAGDRLLVAGGASARRYQFAQEEVTASILAGKQQDDIVINLTTVSGNFTLLPEVTFDDSGNLVYSLEASTSFASSPVLEVILEDEVANVQALAGTAPNYTLPISETIEADAVLLLSAMDDVGQVFPVPQSLSIFDVGATQTQLSPLAINVELTLETEGLEISRLSMLSSPFPTPITGLPDSVRQVTDLHAINTMPGGGAFAGILTLNYDADSLLASVPDAVTIYHWSNGWQPLPTIVNTDTLVQNAIVEINEEGWYAAYLDLTRTTRTGIEHEERGDASRGFKLHQNYPNPFNSITTIEFELEQPAHVRVRVFNALGQEIATIVEGQHQTGGYAFEFDASQLPPGVYFYQLDAGGQRTERAMIRLR